MSLVAYGSSDESSDEEEVKPQNGVPAPNEAQAAIIKKETVNSEKDVIDKQTPQNSKLHLSLPTPIHEESSAKFDDYESNAQSKDGNNCRIQFGALPKPISVRYNYEDVVEDDDIPLFKPKEITVEKPVKQERAPVRISVPSLSDFKDVDEELEKTKHRRTASKKGTGLFAVLPPPQSEMPSKKNNLIPHVLTKAAANLVPKKAAPVTKVPEKMIEKSVGGKLAVRETKNPLAVLDYDSNSEDDEEGGEKHDFFSLTKPEPAPEPVVSSGSNFFSIPEKVQLRDPGNSETVVKNLANEANTTEIIPDIEASKNSGKTLVSTVMNLPREEILLKNKAEVGPKLPVPEQEFNVDSEGNVAFDEKAIEYLCGKRGIKRKDRMIDEANIIEINGEDIKPDEREWMVKALTEEPVQRPISMQGAGPSSQSKKKHQITYLAHQAKAMEVELKNTWSQNRMARKQTQSKYGF